MRFFISIAVLLTSLSALAEYRAFELAITDTNTGKVRKVTTTLDHIQFRGYHPVASFEVVSIEATWMCKQRGDWFTDICPNPATVKTLQGQKTQNQAGQESKSASNTRAPASL
jgi:hypothetical protein